jgi:ERCC4-type nuclease
MLVDLDIRVLPVEEDEGNVDRYVLSNRVAVERRAGNSFVRGIMEKTLFTSAIYLREHFEVPILIVEGEVNYEYGGMNPQAVRGAFSSMMLLYGVNVLATPGPEETAAVIAMIARQEQVGIPEISLVPKRKATDLPDMQRRVIEMLPGSGMTLARTLLQHFGSVQRIVNATEGQLLAVKGIGTRTAREMTRVLTAEYEAVDTERDLEDAIVEDHSLLFAQPVDLVDRQHYLYSDEEGRQFIDLVFMDVAANEVVLVELKRGKLAHEHQDQLIRYLDNADRSKVIGGLLEQGMELRGVLATVEACDLRARRRNVSVTIVDRKAAIEVLKRRRAERQAAAPARAR